MRACYGDDWLSSARRPAGAAPDQPLDAYGLLKTMEAYWKEAFAQYFASRDQKRIRPFITLALEARNAAAHACAPLEDPAALRYLDAIHQLLLGVGAAGAEIEEAKRLYDEQRRGGIPKPAEDSSADKSALFDDPPYSPRYALKRDRFGLHAERWGFQLSPLEFRLFEYIRTHPDLDDDELTRNLGITLRQTVNQAARKLKERGLISRFEGHNGKIVNRETETKP